MMAMPRQRAGPRPRPAAPRRLQRCASLGRHGPSCPCRHRDAAVQPKVAVGPPGDRYEREADELAARIQAAARAPEVDDAPAVQAVSRLDAVAGATAWEIAEPDRGGGRPLWAATRAFMQPSFGADFSAVRVHQTPADQAAAEALHARAFTLGSHVWLGRGESEADRSLMAHELTHVVQQGAADSGAVQRQMSCNVPSTTVDLYVVSLPGSTRAPDPDVQRANEVWSQCNVAFRLVGGETWTTGLLDLQAPKGVLNEYASPAAPTPEETAMLAHRPGGAAIPVYYVPSLERSEAESFWPAAAGLQAVVIGDGARSISLAHELGHVLGNSGGHDPDRNNLMASGSVNTSAGHLRCDQCP
jgi:hypothetical protein